MRKTLVAIVSLAFAMIAVPGAAAQVPVLDEEQHCTLPTTWECIKAYGDMIFEGEHDEFLVWACGFVTAGNPNCQEYGNDVDHVCVIVTGYPCQEDE